MNDRRWAIARNRIAHASEIAGAANHRGRVLPLTEPETEIETEIEREHELDGDELRPGTQIAEYVLEALLGAGGFARVYRARHTTLGTPVAIKVLDRALALDPQAMVRFVREAQAATRISHPNVVRVLGFGRHGDGRAYQIMDLVEGLPLDQHIAAVGRLPVGEVLALLVGIVAGLDAAHAAGIIHRDLKPANILLARADGQLVPRLADFGIAKAIGGADDPRLTQTGATLGTPMYMSPEQALGRVITNASDVYALGVVVYELLTGRVPFAAESPFETMMMHVQSEPALVSAAVPELGTAFDGVLRRMLDKEPTARPSLADAMRELRAASVAPGRAGRTRRTTLLVVLAGAILASGAAWWVLAAPRSPEPAPARTASPPAPAAAAAAPAPAPAPSPEPTPAPAPAPAAAPASAPDADRRPAAPTAPPSRAVAPAPPRRRVLPLPAGPAAADSLEVPSDYPP